MALPTLHAGGSASGSSARLVLLASSQPFWVPQGAKSTSWTENKRSVAKEKLNIYLCIKGTAR